MLKRLIRRMRGGIKRLRGSDKAEAQPASPARGEPPRPANRPSDGSVRRHSPDRRPQSHGHGGRGRADPGPQSPPRRPHPSQQPQHRHPGPTHEPLGSWSLSEFVVAPEDGKTRFHDLDLPAEIMRAVCELGFQYCTPIQARSLPPALEGKNVAGRAQTGTGKTAAFLITILARFLRAAPPANRKPGAPRALVLAPTRELVAQIQEEAEDLGRYCPVAGCAVFGGMDFEKQRRTITAGPIDFIAATPGRLLDFRSRGCLDLGSVEIFVIDEADRMLDMGFIPDVKRIVHALPPKHARQTMMFSATLSSDIVRLASQWTVDPVTVEVEPEKVTVDAVEQIVYVVNSRDKFSLLLNLLRQPRMSRVIVFGNRRDTTWDLCAELRHCGIKCDLLSGAMPQNSRMRILDDFREGRLPVVVATDVAGRGIHVDDVSHVINYDLPYEAEDYVHRIGRTARVGKNGIAISFACDREAFTIPEIEKFIGRGLPCVQPEEALLKPPESRRPMAAERSRPPRPPHDRRQQPRDGRRGRRDRHAPKRK